MRKGRKILALVTAVSAVCLTVAFLVFWPGDSPSDLAQVRIRHVLGALEHAQPLADADRAAARGDYRLVAISGYGPVIPAPETVQDRVMKDLCDYRFVPFTSDAGDELTWRLNGVAWNYAKEYNARLVDRAGVNTVCPTTPRLARENGARAVLAELEVADPTKDADKAIAEGDYRIIGFGGWKSIAPGPDSLRRAFEAGCCDFRPVDHANSDDPTPSEIILTRVAETYGAKYNSRLLERLGLEVLCPFARSASGKQ